MCPIECHHYRSSSVTLKVTFAVCNLSVSNNSKHTARIIYGMLTRRLVVVVELWVRCYWYTELYIF